MAAFRLPRSRWRHGGVRHGQRGAGGGSGHRARRGRNDSVDQRRVDDPEQCDSEGEGLSYDNNGAIQKGYDKADKRPIIPALVQATLAKYGTLLNARSGSVQLTRA